VRISYALISIYEQCNTSSLVGLDKLLNMEETETSEMRNKWKRATEETETTENEKGRRYKCIAVNI
jgi:hypothetical protein